jgi:adenylate cyclase
VQEELANRVAGLLDSQVRQDGLRRARRRPVASLDAYDLYLQGRDLHGRTTAADTLAAREILDRAIAMDPDYASAYAWQAYTVQRGFTFDWGEPRGRAALDLALRLANRAVTLEPDSSLGLMRLAFVLSLLGRSEEALETGRSAVLANPCDFGGRASYGEILSHAGEHEAGVAELRLAIGLNPFHPPFWRAVLGRALLLAGHSEDALAELRRCAALAPDYRPCHTSLVVAYVESGRLEEARAALREYLRLRPSWTLSTYNGVWGFRREADTVRFLTALRTAGMPE